MDSRTIKALGLRFNLNEMGIFNEIISYTTPTYPYLEQLRDFVKQRFFNCVICNEKLSGNDCKFCGMRYLC